MSQKERHALHLPMPAGGKDFVPVDPQRLDPSVLEVFKWVADGKKGGSWKPNHGFAFLRERAIDTTILRDSYQRIMEEIEAAFAVYDDEGRARFKEFMDGVDVLGLLNALAEHRVHTADTALQSTLYALLALVSGLLHELAEAKKTSANLAATTDHLSESFRQIDESSADRLRTWGESAEHIVGIHDELVKIEEALVAFRDMTRDAEKVWKRNCARGNPTIHAACVFLDGNDSDEGFTLRAMSASEEDASVRTIFEPLVALAREHTGTCQAFEVQAIQDWHALVRDVPTEVTSHEQRTRILCDQLREARRTFDDRQSQSKVGTALPYEMGWGTKETYDHAVRIKSDPQWVANVVRSRIERIATDIHRILTDAPRLPTEVRETLRNAERQANKLEASWGIDVSFAEDVPATVEDGASMRKAETAQPLVASRAEELYELLMCVAHELTCNHKMPCGSWVSSMLDLLFRMQRCTAEEKVLYHDTLKARFDHESAFAETSVIPRWKESSKTWIAYRDPRTGRTRFKLALSAKRRAEGLLAKYEMQGAAIRAAHVVRRSEQEATFFAKGGKRTPPQP